MLIAHYCIASTATVIDATLSVQWFFKPTVPIVRHAWE